MKRYRWLRKFLSVFLLGYFFLGQAFHWFPTRLVSHEEVFPVFSWYLFHQVPVVRVRYALRLHELHGQVLDPAVFYEEAEGIVARPHSTEAQTTIRRLAEAIEAGHDDTIRHLKQVLETEYLPPNVRYELVQRIFDPLERWRNGTYSTTPLRMLNSGEEP